uniref:Peroxisomal membrane protein PEX13 n=1 Tax=Clastoptera arizonana TaxID=38151 RepID=A0A1B6BXX4_9HEMI
MNNNQNRLDSNFVHSLPNPLPHSNSGPNQVGSIRTVVPPTLPQRPQLNHFPVQNFPQQYGMNSYGSRYGYGSHMGNYLSNAGYRGYGNFGPSGYGGYPYSGRPIHSFNGWENRLINYAEESSRPAFQSIESLVNAFSSVSMMLESTFLAMQSSFGAVIGLTDNFSRLRQLSVQYIPIFAVLRFIQNFLRRLLYFFGIIKNNPNNEQLWHNAQLEINQSQMVQSQSVWPVLGFLGFLFAGPYLLSKFLGLSRSNSGHAWNPLEEPGFLVIATYPFGTNYPTELSFKKGQKLQLAPKKYNSDQRFQGWLLAADEDGKIGLVPANYISMIKSTSQINNSSVKQQMQQDPIPEPKDIYENNVN